LFVVSAIFRSPRSQNEARAALLPDRINSSEVRFPESDAVAEKYAKARRELLTDSGLSLRCDQCSRPPIAPFAAPTADFAAPPSPPPDDELLLEDPLLDEPELLLPDEPLDPLLPELPLLEELPPDELPEEPPLDDPELDDPELLLPDEPVSDPTVCPTVLVTVVVVVPTAAMV
jgi:hypothetical protein